MDGVLHLRGCRGLVVSVNQTTMSMAGEGWVAKLRGGFEGMGGGSLAREVHQG